MGGAEGCSPVQEQIDERGERKSPLTLPDNTANQALASSLLAGRLFWRKVVSCEAEGCSFSFSLIALC